MSTYPCTKFSCGKDFEEWVEKQEHSNKAVLDGIDQTKVQEWNTKGASICIVDGELRLCDKDGNRISGVDICKSDGVSIERGADGSMCVIGIKNKNTGGIISIWLGTIEQYKTITVPNPHYLYWVTDMSMAQIITTLNNLVTRMGTAETDISTLKTDLTSLQGTVSSIQNGNISVGKALQATNVTSSIGGKSISTIFETDGVTVKNATKLKSSIPLKVAPDVGYYPLYEGSGLYAVVIKCTPQKNTLNDGQVWYETTTIGIPDEDRDAWAVGASNIKYESSNKMFYAPQDADIKRTVYTYKIADIEKF